jgi:signal transduction histidine kinase
MAIVHALVTAHGGHIAIDTSPGHGVRITVSLPLPTASAAPTAAGPEPLDHEVR